MINKSPCTKYNNGMQPSIQSCTEMCKQVMISYQDINGHAICTWFEVGVVEAKYYHIGVILHSDTIFSA